jgi:hypothetical protein
MLPFCVLWLPTWLLLHGNMRDMGSVEAQRMGALALVGAVLLIALFNVILSIVLAPLLNKIVPLLASERRGRIVLAALCGSVLLGGLVLPAFTGAAVLSTLMARQAVNEWRYRADWA